MMIPKTAIDDVAQRLRTVIEEKKQKFKSAIESMDFVERLAIQLAELKEVINKGKVQMKKEENEIREMYQRLKEIENVREINTEDPRCEDKILSYVEGQSIISNANNSKVKDPTEALNENIKLLLDRIQQLLKDNISKSADKSVRSYSKPQESVKTRIFRPQEVQLKIPSPPVSKDPKSAIMLKIKGEVKTLSDLKMDMKNLHKTATELAMADKLCKECEHFKKDVLILKCQCVFCVNCLRKLILKKNTKLLYTTFEAYQKRQETMCVCPIHGFHIEPTILGKLFGMSTIEALSIEALKRQLKTSTVNRVKFPNICADCKALIKDDRNSREGFSLCRKHKICPHCFE